MGYYLAMKRNEVLKRATAWMNLEDMKEASHKRPHPVRFRLRETSRIGKLVRIESRLVVAKSGNKGGLDVDWLLMGTGFLSAVIKMF